jgi:hypothetical protein
MVGFPFMGDIFLGIKPLPLALQPRLALHPPPVEGKFPGMSLSSRIVIDQGMPWARGLQAGPYIMGWVAALVALTSLGPKYQT